MEVLPAREANASVGCACAEALGAALCPMCARVPCRVGTRLQQGVAGLAASPPQPCQTLLFPQALYSPFLLPMSSRDTNAAPAEQGGEDCPRLGAGGSGSRGCIQHCQTLQKP